MPGDPGCSRTWHGEDAPGTSLQDALRGARRELLNFRRGLGGQRRVSAERTQKSRMATQQAIGREKFRATVLGDKILAGQYNTGIGSSRDGTEASAWVHADGAVFSPTTSSRMHRSIRFKLHW